MEADGIFIYGNLREGGRNHGWLQRTNPEGVTAAWIPGRLFHLPSAGFPAMIPMPEGSAPPPGQGWVAGDFVGYEDEELLENALGDLDQLEDVAGDLFQRMVLPVVLDSGHRYQAWVYVFPADRLLRLEREGIELPSGDWKGYLSD
jgi:gamma-glutamylcyclotransferase (GGCT)/AIG2-like uncharacterized protein YtfP